ncbi:MAG: hypothetical protein M0R37_05375 [Bacteroidales bacterium]|nr:hypothetical protein [Bacteroidales bacterium]
MKNKLVAIVIPLYYTNLGKFDRLSVSRCFEFWKDKFDIYFVKPESLDISEVQEEYRGAEAISFTDSYFSDIKGYNRLMLSADFYGKFLDYEYIFLYQTDGYVFKDELEDWCGKGYDYIGAPWIPSPKPLPYLDKIFVKMRQIINKWQEKPDRSELYYQVGNGGVSLRKSVVFHNTALSDKENIDLYVSRLGKSSLYNEDVYWFRAPGNGTDGKLYKPGFSEALSFAFDMNPGECLRLNNGRLPFCCHGFSKPKFQKFWKRFINLT